MSFWDCWTAHKIPRKAAHPYIWTTNADRPLVLKRIGQSETLTELVARLHNTVDEAVNNHVTDPKAFISKIPVLGGANVHAHQGIFNQAVISAVLYYLTQEAKYAQFSADILHQYMAKLAEQNDKAMHILGGQFEDGRWSYGQFAITYDFIYPFLIQPNAMVYDLQSDKRIAFDNAAAQKSIHGIANACLETWGKPDQPGRYISNHHILTLPARCIRSYASTTRPSATDYSTFSTTMAHGPRHPSRIRSCQCSHDSARASCRNPPATAQWRRWDSWN